jgi:RNA polymerase sigma-70 factor (ECF subfamily)
MQAIIAMERVGSMAGLDVTVFDPQANSPEDAFQAPTFEELFNTYQPLVYGIALKFTGNPQDAEDVTQEAFTKIWKNLEGFKFQSSIKTWIYRIALNSCIDHSRKPWKRLGQRSTDLDEALDAGEESVQLSDDDTAEHKLLAKEKAAQVRKAITGLKPHLRAVLVLKDLEEMSYEEISSILGIGLGTISSRLNRARKALQEVFQNVMPALF